MFKQQYIFILLGAKQVLTDERHHFYDAPQEHQTRQLKKKKKAFTLAEVEKEKAGREAGT